MHPRGICEWTFRVIVLASIFVRTQESSLEEQRGPRAPGVSRTAAEREAEFVIRALRDSRNQEDGSTEGITTSLVEHGASAMDAMIQILVERKIPALLPTEHQQVLSVPQRRLLLEALASNREGAIEAIESRLKTHGSMDDRIAGVYVYGVAGQARDLPRVLELALLDDEPEPAPALLEALQFAFTETLVRHPDAFTSLGFMIGNVRPELRQTLIFAVGATRDSRGLEVLAEILPFHPELVDVAIAQARLLGRSGDPDVNARFAAEIGPLLDGERVELACAVAHALGELAVCEAVPQLIELLESQSLPLREGALWALRRMSRHNYSASPKLWQLWFESEEKWWKERSPKEFDRLGHGTFTQRLRALQTLADRSLHRDEIAESVAFALEQHDPAVRTRACQALGQLGSPAGSLALAWALADREPAVRAAARAALAEIHAVEIPDEPEACMRLLRL